LPAKQVVHKEQNNDLSNDSQTGNDVRRRDLGQRGQHATPETASRTKQIPPGRLQRALVHKKSSTPLGSKSSNHQEYRQDVAGKFFENATNHPNPLVRESVNYNENVA
jgi:hypothetical protein